MTTDAAYLDPEATHTLQVTAWIPLLDAKAENGCLQGESQPTIPS